MKSAVETLSPTRVKLTVEVPFEELKPALDAAYKRIAAQITVPGFRKGKVPNRVIDQRVGRAAVLDEALNDAVNANLDAALRENDIKLLGRPEVDIADFEDATPLVVHRRDGRRPRVRAAGLRLDRGRGRRRRGHRGRRRRAARRPARPLRRRSAPSSGRPPTATSCSSTSPARHDGEAVEDLVASRAVLRARHRRHAPRLRRGGRGRRRPARCAPSPSPPRAASTRARTSSVTVTRHRRPRARAARRRRRLRPARQRVRHDRRAARRPAHAPRPREAASSRATRPATRSPTALLEARRRPDPRGRDHASRSRTTSPTATATTTTAPRSRPRPATSLKSQLVLDKIAETEEPVGVRGRAVVLARRSRPRATACRPTSSRRSSSTPARCPPPSPRCAAARRWRTCWSRPASSTPTATSSTSARSTSRSRSATSDDHEGHDHEGHDHEGHDHDDHEGHDHD